MTTETLALNLLCDCPLTDASQTAQRTFEVTVTAAHRAPVSDRAALNLALVLDRSGSMAGDKLAYVKQAACHVLDLLNERDRVAIIAYDDTIQALAASQPVTAAHREEMKRRIRALRCGNSTNLGEGWLRGAGEVAENLLAAGVNRALLMTDGLANVGITDAGALAHHASELRERGVSTSTFGVGLDFDHHLLSSMAERGGGHFYFIENPRQIPELFQRELGELLTVVAREACLTLTLPRGIAASLLGDLPHEKEERRLRVQLGDLFSGEQRAFYLEAQVPPAAPGERLSFHADLRYVDLENRPCHSDAESAVTSAEREAAEAAPHDKALLERASLVYMAGLENQALQMERAGQPQQASLLMQAGVVSRRKMLSAESMDEYRVMADAMEVGLTEEQRKQRHTDAYQKRHQRK